MAAAIGGQPRMPYEVAKLYAVQHPLLAQYTADGYTLALEQLVKQSGASYVVFPHTYQVRDFGPKLATRFRPGAHRRCHRAFTVEAGKPVFVRQLLQGKLNADYRIRAKAPCFVSVQAGASAPTDSKSGQAPVETFTPQLDAAQIRSKPRRAVPRMAAQTVDLTPRR